MFIQRCVSKLFTVHPVYQSWSRAGTNTSAQEQFCKIGLYLNELSCKFSKLEQEREMKNTPLCTKHKLINSLHSPWPSSILKRLGVFICALKDVQMCSDCFQLNKLLLFCKTETDEEGVEKITQASETWNEREKKNVMHMQKDCGYWAYNWFNHLFFISINY